MNPVGRGIHTLPGQHIEFAHQPQRVDHHAAAQNAPHVRMDDARRSQVQFECTLTDDHRMPGVIAPGVARHDISLTSQPIRDAALAFIAPLRPDQNCYRHNFLLPTNNSCPNDTVIALLPHTSTSPNGPNANAAP